MAAKPRFDGEWVKLNQLCTKGRSALRQKDLTNDGPYAVYGASGIVGSMPTFQNDIRYVAVVKDGAGVGRASLCSANTSVLGTMQALIPVEEVSPEYLLHLIRAMRLGDGFSGSTIPHIYFKDYGQRLVRRVSMVDQGHIVDTLGSIERQMDIARGQLTKLDDFVKSRFAEMFENDSLVERAQLKDICSLITDGTHQSPRFQGEGIPFLFVSNIADNKISYETTKFISKEDYEALIARTPIEVGDVLMSAVGSFGHPAIVKDERPFCFQRHIAYLKPIRERVNSSFLHAALLSEESQQYMDKAAKGAAQRTVTLRSFKDLAVPLPPLALQQEFADFAAEVDKSRFVVRN